MRTTFLLVSRTVAVFVLAAFFLAAKALWSADTFTQPFSPDSLWNRQVPSNAVYEEVEGMSKVDGSINFQDRWTTFVYPTDASSRKAKLYIADYTLHGKRARKEVAYTNNPDEIEDKLRASSKAMNVFPANYYSTIQQSPPGKRMFPLGLRDLHKAWRDFIFVPNESFTPSPDSDGQLAIWQPDGLVLECYCAVICKNGDVIATMASFTDPASDGSGLQNGRRASLIPNYAGLIRQGEVASGEIRHALACTFPPNLQTTRAVYPAAAFDMNDRYKGSVPMGSLLAIPPDFDLKTLGLPKAAMVIAAAMQRYGIYVVDRGGEGLTVVADQRASDAANEEVREHIPKIVQRLKIVKGLR